jgi:hypothetical protein
MSNVPSDVAKLKSSAVLVRGTDCPAGLPESSNGSQREQEIFMFFKGFPSSHGRRNGPSKANAAIAGAALAVLAALTAGAGAAHANLIVNGNFSANASSYTAYPGYSQAPNPSAPTGWTTGDGGYSVSYSGVNGPDTGFFAASGSPFAPSSTTGVNDFNFMQGPGVYTSQTTTTAVGQSYTLTFDAAQRSGDPNSVLEVIVTNATNGNQIATSTPTINDTSFATFSLNFTAASGSTGIEFLNNSGTTGDNTVDVTNVSMAEAAVPEPASLGLLAIGGLGLLMVSRRRATRQST